MRKRIALSIASALAVGYAMYRFIDTPAEPVVAAAPEIAAPNAAPSATEAPGIPTLVQQPPASVLNINRTSPKSVAFFGATDLKQVLADARSNPEAGSFYYATLAIAECETTATYVITAIEGADNTGGPKREAIIERAKRRCANLTEEDMATLRELGDEGLKAGDVGFAVVPPLSSDVTPTNGSASKKRYIDALYDSRADAGVMMVALSELALAADALAVNGRRLSELQKSSLPAALLLLGCEMGVPCDERHPIVRFECLGHGRCNATDLPAVLQSTNTDFWGPYTHGTRFDYEAALTLKDELAAGIARGDTSTLTFVGR